MIDALDNMLQQLFITNVDEITDLSQVGFDPPDDKWRSYVSGLTVKGNPVNALNVYLVDLKENRVLRSNERTRDFQNGLFTEIAAPRRVDCHYLISAWSGAESTAPPDTLDPTVDEHALLYKATAALMDAEPFIPSQIHAGGSLPDLFPPEFADDQLPSTILPVEGFPKLAEFWGATKTVHWKPAIYLVVTLPVVLPLKITGPMVTTRITEYRLNNSSQTGEVWIQIGGIVLTGAGGAPITGAWVMLEDSTKSPLQTTTTDADGHFTFSGLTAGNYFLRARAQGYAEKPTPTPIVVPSPTGTYEVQLT
jgi:uncharacterized protein DUF4255/carboxypeptidase family protein